MESPTSHSGRHVILECFGSDLPKNRVGLESLLRRAAETGGAQVLSCHMHNFGNTGGITGVMLLAESHITVHTWPEREYAAFDVFMCGNCDADAAAAVISRSCPNGTIEVKAIDRPVSSVT